MRAFPKLSTACRIGCGAVLDAVLDPMGGFDDAGSALPPTCGTAGTLLTTDTDTSRLTDTDSDTSGFNSP
jgi:hypothetical protein